MTLIRAPFTVTVRTSELDTGAEPELPAVALTTFDKVFLSGGLVASSVVVMVSAGSASGPLAYVALERVEGTLEGRPGAFVLRHVGAIVEGTPSVELDVVHGSGTSDLVGLSGHGTIEHTAEGQHLELDYELPG